MHPVRLSASSYSNTAPLVWSFLYGAHHGKVELILDNAPARSAQLLAEDRVDAALVPIICAQTIEGVKLIPDVCIGSKQRVRSVCLVTNGLYLESVRSVSLDTSSRTSVILTKLIFREFLGFEPEWRDADPDVEKMLKTSDAALIIGDPALAVARDPARRTFDLAELWHHHTGLGFVFAMWMTRRESCDIDFAAARDEGVSSIDEISAIYAANTGLNREEMVDYLKNNIAYSVNETMREGMELYFELAAKHDLIEANKPPRFV